MPKLDNLNIPNSTKPAVVAVEDNSSAAQQPHQKLLSVEQLMMENTLLWAEFRTKDKIALLGKRTIEKIDEKIQQAKKIFENNIDKIEQDNEKRIKLLKQTHTDKITNVKSSSADTANNAEEPMTLEKAIELQNSVLELKKQLQNKQNEICNFEEKLKLKTADFLSLTSDFESLKSEFERREIEHEQGRTDFEIKLVNMNSSHAELVNNISEEKQNLLKEWESAKFGLAELRKSYESLLKLKSDDEYEKVKLKQAKANLEKNVQISLAKVEHMKSSLSVANVSNEKLKSENEEVKNQLEKIKQQLPEIISQAVEKYKSQFVQQNESLYTNLQQSKYLHDVSQNEVNRLKAENSVLRQELHSKIQELDLLHKRWNDPNIILANFSINQSKISFDNNHKYSTAASSTAALASEAAAFHQQSKAAAATETAWKCQQQQYPSDMLQPYAGGGGSGVVRTSTIADNYNAAVSETVATPNYNYMPVLAPEVYVVSSAAVATPTPLNSLEQISKYGGVWISKNAVSS